MHINMPICPSICLSVSVYLYVNTLANRPELCRGPQLAISIVIEMHRISVVYTGGGRRVCAAESGGGFVVCAFGIGVACCLDGVVEQFSCACAGDRDIAVAEVFGGSRVASHVYF